MHPSVDHFIVRPDADDGTPGPIVPLVAVDQLPDWMQLSGVPRELDAEQTIGLANLGIVDKKDDNNFEVRLHHGKIRAILNSADEKTGLHSSAGGKGKAKATKKKAAPHAETKSKSIEKTASEESLPASTGTSSSPEPGPVEKPKPPVHPAERMLSASRHNTANIAVGTQTPNSISEKPLRPHMTEATRNEPRPAAPKDNTTQQDKQPTSICRHWCHHGTCKFGLKCRHQHRMPTTVEGLAEVGLKDFPTWYLLMMSGGGLPGLISMDTMLSGHGEGQPSPVRQHAAAEQQQQPAQPLIQRHVPDASALDLRLAQERMSALLASSGAVSNRKKLKQLREVRHLLLRGAHAPAAGAQGGQQQQQPRPHNNSGNYANLYTNASVAANAASIRRQAERQQQVRDDMPVVTRVRAREVVEDIRGQAIVAGTAGVVEENLLDID
ncbi:hypothetical protein SLS64_002136 [Diaporthe eres]|uniref:C3H1-type domain-containing protein n=1 Tax=Diaporthe eres TaxID=83184 RepID=A0ABR1PN21_DIAER